MIGFINKFLLGIWNIGVIEDCAENVVEKKCGYTVRWMKHNYRDRFFADPFLHHVDENWYYILAEEYPFYDSKGYISMLKVRRRDMKLVDRDIIICGDTHYSYPFVCGEWIIPENFRSGKTVAYRYKDGRIIEKCDVMDHGLIDQTFLIYGRKEWIFATDEDNPLCGLKIYYRDIGCEHWIEHKKNPVNVSIKNARPGGHFFRIGENLYRPAQDSDKIYGNKIRIMRVDILNELEYKETEVAVLSSESQKRYKLGFHTFNVEDGFIVCDGYQEYYSFFIKPFCLKLPWLMRRIGGRKWTFRH